MSVKELINIENALQKILHAKKANIKITSETVNMIPLLDKYIDNLEAKKIDNKWKWTSLSDISKRLCYYDIILNELDDKNELNSEQGFPPLKLIIESTINLGYCAANELNSTKNGEYDII